MAEKPEAGATTQNDSSQVEVVNATPHQDNPYADEMLN